MNTRSALPWLLALPFWAPALSLADVPPAPAASATVSPAGPDDEKKTDLEKRMDRMGKAFRKLRKQVSDPAQNESSLQLLSTMDEAAKESLQFTPEKAADLPEDQRAKFEDDFKAGIKGLQDEFAKLRDALTAGRNDDAVKIVAEIANTEKKDHKQFKKPKPD